jgi:hypothetical protein
MLKQMKKTIISVILTITIISCKGPGSGPLVKESFDEKKTGSAMTGQQHQQQAVTAKADVKIDPCADCITIGRLIADKKSFSGKTIRVKGQVTKINEQIMGKNWIHIQDGTEAEGAYDLTVTSSQTVTVGETVTFEGKIVLDKDFGYGYFYNVLMEEGQLIK